LKLLFTLETSKTALSCNGNIYAEEGAERITPGEAMFYVYIFISVALVLTGGKLSIIATQLTARAGLMSGLTIGLMSLDMMNLEVIRNGGDPKEAKYAERIIPVIKQHHILLVTLLLTNAAAMEALPIFLDRISSPAVAILISVTMVLFFGE
jgi:metal transporter CNNM